MSAAAHLIDAAYHASLPSVADVLAAYQQVHTPATVAAATLHHHAPADNDDISSDTDDSDSGETSATSWASDDDDAPHAPAPPLRQTLRAALIAWLQLVEYSPGLQFASGDGSSSEDDGATEDWSGESDEDDATEDQFDDSEDDDDIESPEGDGAGEAGWDSENEDLTLSYSDSYDATESDLETKSDGDNASEYTDSEERAVTQYPPLGSSTALTTNYMGSPTPAAPYNGYYLTAAAPAAAAGSNARSTASDLHAGAVHGSSSRVAGVEGSRNDANPRAPSTSAAAAAAAEQVPDAQQPGADAIAAMMPFDALAEAYNACRVRDDETGDGWPWF